MNKRKGRINVILIVVFVLILIILVFVLLKLRVRRMERVEVGPIATSPRDLFDINVIKSRSLEELKWKETNRKTLPNGVIEIQGSYSSGFWNTVKKSDVKANNFGNKARIELLGEAIIYIPPGYPNVVGNGFGAVMISPGVEAEVLPEQAQVFFDTAIEIAEKQGVPVILHKIKRSVWNDLGYNGEDDIMGNMFVVMMKDNQQFIQTLEGQKSMYIYALAKDNLHTITLLQRIAEQFGGNVREVHSSGGSKAGWTQWEIGAVDDRISFLSPRRYPFEDVKGMERLETDWGCRDPFGRGDEETKLRLSFARWSQNTPAGRYTQQFYNIPNFQHLLHAKMVLISGDTGVRAADGSKRTHDASFPLGSESDFLKQFPKLWRYARTPDISAVPSSLTERETILWKSGIDSMLSGRGWVKVSDVSTSRNADGSVVVLVSASSPNKITTVRLWGAASSDRRWNDEVDGSWKSFEMTLTDSKWKTEAIKLPEGREFAYYVEAEDADTNGLKRIDASPVFFYNEFPLLSC